MRFIRLPYDEAYLPVFGIYRGKDYFRSRFDGYRRYIRKKRVIAYKVDTVGFRRDSSFQNVRQTVEIVVNRIRFPAAREIMRAERNFGNYGYSFGTSVFAVFRYRFEHEFARFFIERCGNRSFFGRGIFAWIFYFGFGEQRFYFGFGKSDRAFAYRLAENAWNVYFRFGIRFIRFFRLGFIAVTGTGIYIGYRTSA